MKSIEVSNLSFFYQDEKKILDNISFDINKGEYVAIVGPNGSGKSTLAKALVGLVEIKQGSITILGDKLSKKTLLSIRRKVGMIFQNPDNQFIGATVEDDIAFGLENRLVDRKEIYKTVIEFSNKVGMSSYLDKEPSILSGGQKQRVAIASILSLSPEILIMDEATSMLDPKGRKEIRELVAEIQKANPDLTVISITHDVEEAANADRVLVLVDGKVIKFDKPEIVFNSSEELKKYHLAVPFFFELEEKLQKAGININKENDLLKAREKVCPSK